MDSLPLVQIDEKDLKLNINIINVVYQGLYMVIIAANGYDANTGLLVIAPGTWSYRPNP